MIPRSKEQLAFPLGEASCKAGHGARAVAASAALGQRMGALGVAKGADYLQVWQVVVEDGLPFFDCFVDCVGFPAEAREQGLVLATVVRKAADRG